ncbi:MAG: lysine--tRNA ligase, partial [Oscillospiraceae bacterium]|nr:lysine--tRNA ligase [Oscillospiraceae bacterium]
MAQEKQNGAQAPEMTEKEYGELVAVRREKLKTLREAGKDPFTITKYPQDSFSTDIKAEFDYLQPEEESGKMVCLAGRMMAKRVMGKASFAGLQDTKGRIQLYVRRDVLGEDEYAAFKKMDIGDMIGVKGEVFRTKTGEISIHATNVTLLSKSLQILPEK